MSFKARYIFKIKYKNMFIRLVFNKSYKHIMQGGGNEMRNNRRINLANCNFNLKNNNSPNTNEVKASSFNFWDSVCLQESLQTRRKSQKIKVINNSLEESVQIAKRQTGITLIALVVTIVVLLILAGVSISTVLGNNGIIPKANEAKFKTDLASIQEEFTLYVTDKTVENSDFLAGTLNASSDLLTYNTQPEEEKGTGNISSVLKSSTAQKYIQTKSFSIIKGDLIYASQNARELEWAQEVGFTINPYNIDENGVLLSSDTNLMLMDKTTGTLVIPEMVTAIGSGAFSNVTGLKKVVIPGNVKTIQDSAFAFNETIEEITIMDGVEVIKFQAFLNCTNLKKLTVADSITVIEAQAFRGCIKLESFVVPNKVNTIYPYTFSDCKLLKQIDLNNVEKIERRAFTACFSLSNIEINSSVKVIDPMAFAECNSININISADNNYFIENDGIILNKDGTEMIYITQSAVKNNTLKIPDTIKNLSAIPYNHLQNLKLIEIPNSVISIDDKFFQDRKVDVELRFEEDNEKYNTKNNGVYSKDGTILYTHFKNEKSIVVPEGVKQIKDYAFSLLLQLSQVVFPQSIETIGQYIFRSCYQIHSLSLGKNVKTLGNLFDSYSGINDLTIDKDNPYYTVDNHMIFNKEKTVLIRLIYGTYNEVIVPTGVSDISAYAFSYNFIGEIILPETLKRLDGFQYAFSLQRLEIPSSVTQIGGNCFFEASELKEIIIHKPEGSIYGAPWQSPYGLRAIKWIAD